MSPDVGQFNNHLATAPIGSSSSGNNKVGDRDGDIGDNDVMMEAVWVVMRLAAILAAM
jgi:hypothetical protein